MIEKSKRKRSEGKVYKPEGVRFWGRVVIIVLLGIALLLMLFLINYLEVAQAVMWGFIVLLFALTLYMFILQVAESSLTVYENGLEWRRNKCYLFAEWKNMRAIERKNEGDAASYGIQLVKAVEVESTGWFDKFFYGSATSYIRLTGIVTVPTHWEGFRKGNLIKLEEFADTEFGQDLMRYVPHLFEKDKADGKEKDR